MSAVEAIERYVELLAPDVAPPLAALPALAHLCSGGDCPLCSTAWSQIEEASNA